MPFAMTQHAYIVALTELYLSQAPHCFREQLAANIDYGAWCNH